MYFLCDITNHLSELNELNLKLQGGNKFVWELARTIKEFRIKLDLLKNQIEENDLSHFPALYEHRNEIDDSFHFGQFIERIIEEFEKRFQDFQKYSLEFQFIFEENKIGELSKQFEVENTCLKNTFGRRSLIKQWIN